MFLSWCKRFSREGKFDDVEEDKKLEGCFLVGERGWERGLESFMWVNGREDVVYGSRCREIIRVVEGLRGSFLNIFFYLVK